MPWDVPAALATVRARGRRRPQVGLEGRGREVVPAGQTSSQADATVPPAVVPRMYDTAMERAAVHSRPSLQRYLAVLVTP
jgi:hypothetical protein